MTDKKRCKPPRFVRFLVDTGMSGSCFRYEIQKLAILKLHKLYEDETNPIAIPAVKFRIEAWHYCN